MIRRVANRYLLGKQLGAGGSARVHAALDERLGRQVAIKLLDAERVASADPAGRERFLREGPTTASFSHRNAVTVFDAGEDEGDLYIVMELVDGPSLAEHLSRTARLAVDEATSIGRQVLAALAAAHDVGVVHRDVKPANVLLAADGEVKLADFGIAKRFDDLEELVTSTGTVIGTPRYLAPEQAMGLAVTSATDIYATGILMFEMLTGQPPPPSAPNVRSLRPEVTTQLAATVARALASKPADRFASANEMLAALDDSSAMATQLLSTSAATVRSGETRVMPRAVGTPLPPPIAVSAPSSATATKGVVATLAVLAAVVVVIVLIATRGGTDQLVVGSSTVNSATVPGVSEPAPTSTEIAPTIAITQLLELIPGFLQTDDIEIFLAQLDDEPALVGPRGEELARRLREMLDQHSPKKQRDQAKAIRKDMTEWVKNEELDAAIADALDELLIPFAE